MKVWTFMKYCIKTFFKPPDKKRGPYILIYVGSFRASSTGPFTQFFVLGIYPEDRLMFVLYFLNIECNISNMK